MTALANSNQVAVTTSATLITTLPGRPMGGGKTFILNSGSSNAYLGGSNTVTTSNGYPLLPNTTIAIENFKPNIYAIAAANTTISVLDII